jgi:hypothetical protein
LFNYVFQDLPNRPLSDEGCATTEAEQLYHCHSVSETTLAGSKWKAREQPTSQGTTLPTAQNRAPTDSALLLYEAKNSRTTTNSKQQTHSKGKRAAD